MVFSRFRFKGHFGANNKVNWPHLGEHSEGNKLGNYYCNRTNTIILATALGYRQYDVAETLGVDKATISRWHNGTQEPDDAAWAKLLALKEQLEKTGELSLGATPCNSVQLFSEDKAKKGKKSLKPRAIDTVKDKDIDINIKGTVKSNSKTPTVQAKEPGSPNCAKCPFNGQSETLPTCS